MTLEAFLHLQQQQFENVIVAKTELIVNAELHRVEAVTHLTEEFHPIAADSLEKLKEVWTAQYMADQWNDMIHAKQAFRQIWTRELQHRHDIGVYRKHKHPRQTEATLMLNRHARTL